MMIADGILPYHKRWRQSSRTFVISIGVVILSQPLWSLDIVTIRGNEQQDTVVGEVLVEAQDGGLLMIDRDGVLWTIPPDQRVRHEQSEQTFEPSDPREYAGRLLAELPSSFRLHRTPHYVFIYDTSKAYVKWCGVLYERLFQAFFRFWEKLDVQLDEPRFPLVAIVFADRESFASYAEEELAEAVSTVVGYYSLQTNRVVMYDLTGVERSGVTPRRANESAWIQHVLSQRAAAPNVATIVHEATHQLAYNSGLQTRSAENPLWLSEGLAMFFETPDFRNNKGWKRIGGVHPIRMLEFRKSLTSRSPQRLSGLLSRDDEFRDPQTAGQAYAEAWALSYFLLKKHPHQFAAYIGELSELPPLRTISADERLSVFAAHFGELAALESEFLGYMSKLRH